MPNLSAGALVGVESEEKGGDSLSLSQSSIQTWNRCKKLWSYTYVHSLEPNQSPSKEQRVGTGIHKLLEFYYARQEVDWGQVDLEGDEKSAAAALLLKYQELYPMDESLTYTAELPFKLDAVHGIFDVVHQEPSGRVVITEHKSTRSDFSADEVYFDRVKISWQAGIYQLAARELYKTDDVVVLWDVIRVPQLRQKKGESSSDFRLRVAEDIDNNTERYFGQALIKWSDESLARLKDDLSEIELEIQHGAYPRNRSACFDYRSKCGFHGTCFGDAPLTDERLYVPRKRK